MVRYCLLIVFFLFARQAWAQTLIRFETPQEARDALYRAAKDRNVARLPAILGQDTVRGLLSGDPIADKALLGDLYRRMQAGVRLVQDERKRIYMWFGEEKTSFAVPLLPFHGKWVFDDTGGKEVALSRLIRSNESDAIQVCQLIVEAQMQYYSKDRDGDGEMEYAERVVSSPGSRDGLFWKGQDRSPLGAFVGEAFDEGYVGPARGGDPIYHGYRYRTLRGQGANAPGGTKSYADGMQLTKGFALLAYPVRWSVSGKRTFMVNADSIVYGKDFGHYTAQLAPQIQSFDPDSSWEAVSVDSE